MAGILELSGACLLGGGKGITLAGILELSGACLIGCVKGLWYRRELGKLLFMREEG